MENLHLLNLIDSAKEIIDVLEKSSGDNFTSDINTVIHRLTEMLVPTSTSPNDLGLEQVLLILQMIIFIQKLSTYLTNSNNLEFSGSLHKLVVAMNTFTIISDLSRILDIETEFNRSIVNEIIQVLQTKTLSNIYEDFAIISNLNKLHLPQNHIQAMKDATHHQIKESNKNKNRAAVLLIVKHKLITKSKQFEIKEIKVVTDPSDPSIGKWNNMVVYLEIHSSVLSTTLSEIQFYKKLQNCQFIAQLYGICALDDKTMNICYEYPKSGFLDQLLYSNDLNKSISPIAQSQIVQGIAKGLLFMHSNNIVHGFLESKHIMLDAFMIPKLKIPLHKSSAAISLKWKAPEYWENESIVNTCAGDVYSFGIVVCEIFSKCRPWSNFTDDAIKNAILNGDAPYPNEQIPVVMFESITKCWCTSPIERPTMFQIVNSLNNTYSNQSIRSELATLDELINEFYNGIAAFTNALSPVVPSLFKTIFNKFTIYNIMMVLIYYNMVVLDVYAIQSTSILWIVPLLGILFLIIAISSISMTFYGLYSWYMRKNVSKLHASIQFICLIAVIINFGTFGTFCQNIPNFTNCFYFANTWGLNVLLSIVYTIILLLIIIYFKIDQDTRILNNFNISQEEHGRPIVNNAVSSTVSTRNHIVHWILGFIYLINILTIVFVYANLDALGYLYLPLYSQILVLAISIVSASSTVVGMLGLHRNKNAIPMFQILQIISILLIIALFTMTSMVCYDFTDTYIARNGESPFYNRRDLISNCKNRFQDIEGTLAIWFIINITLTRMLQRILNDNQSTRIIDLLLPNLDLTRKSKIGISFVYFLLLVPLGVTILFKESGKYVDYASSQYLKIAIFLVFGLIIGLMGLKHNKNGILYVNVMLVIAIIIQEMTIMNENWICTEYSKNGMFEYCITWVAFIGYIIMGWLAVSILVISLICKYGKEGFVQLGDGQA